MNPVLQSGCAIASLMIEITILLAKKYGIKILSTGDMLRAAVAAGTEVGKKAKGVMDAGGLVSDEIVIQIIKDATAQDDCKSGFILDGFPRTLAQAEKLDEMLSEAKQKLDGVINFEIADKVLVERIAGRWTHVPSGRSYHTKFLPPKVEGKDDVTGEPLTQRKDDNAESVQARLKSFHSQTSAAIEYYKKKGALKSVNADDKPDNVSAAIAKHLA